MSEKLTVSEALDLQKHEKVIQQHKEAWEQVGHALMDIQDRRLYRKEYKSFDDYLKERWGWTKQHGHRLIDGAKLKAEITKESPVGDAITTERAARALKKVPKNKRLAVVEKIVENGQAVTSTTVKEAAEVVQAETGAKDNVGRIIPNKIIPYWCRIGEVKQLLTTINGIRLTLKKAHDAEDKMYAEVSNTVITDLERVHASMECAVPYAVCPQCQGHPDTQPKSDCRLCKGRGLISKFLWDRAVPAETKKMIEGQVKK